MTDSSRCTGAFACLSFPFSRLTYRAAQRVMRIDITRVVWLEEESASTRPPCEGYTYRFLLPEEIRSYSCDPQHGLEEALAVRIERGRDFCFAALYGERLAAYAWFALHSIEARHNRGRFDNTGIAASYPNDVAFMYKGFTHPDHRGRGLYGQVNGFGLQALRERGVRCLLSTMDWTNHAAWRSCQRLGYVQLGMNYCWGWGDWIKVSSTTGAQRYGVHFGDQAEVIPRDDPEDSGSTGYE